MEIFSEKGKMNYFVGVVCILLSLSCALMAYNSYDAKKRTAHQQTAKAVLDSHLLSTPDQSATFIEEDVDAGAPKVVPAAEPGSKTFRTTNAQAADPKKKAEISSVAEKENQARTVEIAEPSGESTASLLPVKSSNQRQDTELRNAVQEVQQTAGSIVSKLRERTQEQERLEQTKKEQVEQALSKNKVAIKKVVRTDRKKIAVIQDTVKEQENVKTVPHTGTMWVDRDTSRFIVTLGNKHGMKKGDRLDVFSGAQQFSQIEVETVMDVVSYAKPVGKAVDSYSLDYYQVIFNGK